MFFEFENTLYNTESIRTISYGERYYDNEARALKGYYIFINFLDKECSRWVYGPEEKEKFESLLNELRNKLLKISF